MAIGTFDAGWTLAADYLDGRGGSKTQFLKNLAVEQRLGQAFFNALAPRDQGRLQGTLRDPFYMTTPDALIRVIEWLLDTE